MKLLADLHTHSKNSRFNHGKNTIEEMAIAANEMGLVEIGITDHGYAHFFRTTKSKIRQARKIVDEINTWSKTKVLLGVEADIISENGDLDIDNETLAMLDILVVGYHKMIFTDFANFFGKTPKTPEARKKCTNAFINAINKYPVTMVSHLDSILKTDLYEIGKACRQRGTLVEINNRHNKWNEKQIDDLIVSGCLFAVSSDAHSREKVGDVDRALEFIRKYNIPSERVANVEFSEEEKSEADRQFSAYQSVYEQLAKNKKEKENAIEVKNKTEITGKLSDEMEKALKEIAVEKGLDYQERKQEHVEEEYMKNMTDEEIELLHQAEEYIRQCKLKAIQAEFDKKQESVQEPEYSFDDNHPLVSDNFEDKFQAINGVIRESEKEAQINQNTAFNQEYQAYPKQEINHGAGYERNAIFDLQSNVSQYQNMQSRANDIFNSQNDSREQANNLQPQDEYKSRYTQNNTSSESVFEQLNTSSLNGANLQSLKNLMNEGTSNAGFEKNMNNLERPVETQKPSFKKPEPENFMDSITQTRLAKNTEQAKEPEKKPVQKKIAQRNKGNHGAFIVVDNLIENGKK